MVAVSKQRYISPEDYLKHERLAPTKSEYIDGQIFAMAGASRQHNRITFNVGGLLHAQLQGKPCEGFSNDMRVKVEDDSLYTYPDVVVACGEAKFADEALETLLNPTLIIEVLSDSTEKYDRGKKFAHYQRIESLQEYVLISQDEARIECFTRQPDDRWMLSKAERLEDVITLESIDCTLPLTEVYARVQFESSERTQTEVDD